jgi:hypothetical protein
MEDGEVINDAISAFYAHPASDIIGTNTGSAYLFNIVSSNAAAIGVLQDGIIQLLENSNEVVTISVTPSNSCSGSPLNRFGSFDMFANLQSSKTPTPKP